MIGLGIIAIPYGMISSALTEARNLEKNNEKKQIIATYKMYAYNWM